jgi:hypothetical protein
MPRRVSRRRLVVAAALVVLAVLPSVVNVAGGAFHVQATQRGVVFIPTEQQQQPALNVEFLGRHWFLIEVASADLVVRVGVAWYWYRRCWWILALVAALVVVRPLLPIPSIFGPDDG